MSHVSAAERPARTAQVWIDSDGGWRPSTVADAAHLRKTRPAPGVWVRIADAAQLDDVATRLGVPGDAWARLDARTRHPHVERLGGGGLVLAIPTLTYRERTRDVLTGSMTIVLADDVILTFEDGDARTLTMAADRLLSADVPPERGVGQVLAALLLVLVGSAGEVEGDLGQAVADAEAIVFSTAPVDPVPQIYALKREIAEARRALVPFGTEFSDLVANDEDSHRSGQAKHWLVRLEKVVDRLDRKLETHDRLLGDLLSASLSRVSIRQNEDMRKISAWAAIAAVPTLVAGVYGMNFRNMPELGWTFGYPGAVLAMVAVCAVLFRVFKRSGWL